MPNSVIVISSVNQDTALSVPYFPRPGETLHSNHTTTSLGGKGANVAIAAAHATNSVYLVGAIGPDGGHEEATLKSHGVDTSFLMRTDTGTGRAVILVNPSGENCIIVSKGANALVTANVAPELEREMNGSVVVLQLEIEHEVTQDLAIMANKNGATVVFNPSPAPPECSVVFEDEAKVWKAAQVVILNEVEIEQICGVGRKQGARDEVEAWRESIEHVCKRCREDVMLLLTLGKAGVVYYTDGSVKHVASVDVDEVVDTTGAGDTFTGFLAGGLAEGKELDECVGVAAAAGAACVRRRGAADSIPTMEQVEQMLQKLALSKQSSSNVNTLFSTSLCER